MIDEKPSLILGGYASRADQLGVGQTALTLIAEDPFIAVGVEGGSDTPFLLILPEGSVFDDKRTDNLRVLKSRELNIRFDESNIREIKRCTTISFRSLTKASELLLDVLVETAIETQDPRIVGELTQDFIELFNPARSLSPEEVLGLFGELLVIWSSADRDAMARSWHQRERDQYDFALENDRLEVKTTRGPDRRHRFSSNQIPPRDGLHLAVVSIVTDEVSAGTSVRDLHDVIVEELGSGTTSRNVTKHFTRIFQRGEDLCSNTFFDLKQAQNTLKLYDGFSVPFLELTPGVLSAKWEADFTNARELGPTTNFLASQLSHNLT
jgi:hypothetical protein